MMENKSLMVFNVTIDLSNRAQVEALNEFTKKMNETYSREEAPEQKPVENPSEQKPATRTRSRKSNPNPAPETPEEKPQEDPVPEETAGTEPQGEIPGNCVAQSIKVEDVRALLAEKVDDHRPEIKKKLTDFGAPNVSALNPEKYGEFMEFLKSL